MKIADIRKGFLNYYKNKQHNIVKSSSLIPNNDETLLFTNAGMVQFKNIFTGIEKRDYNRATSVQKCLRAGGKHNDLDNVGYTARHHTFFEMLGNFSFGDYFKEEAIFYAWDFLTNFLQLPKEKLLVTVYHNDDEAYNLWQKIAGLSSDKIIRISSNDNFWEMGEEGPCGPCTEIFYDHGEEIAGGPPGSKNEDGDRFIEIWNLVFMQYEKLNNKDMINLGKPCIDTGMGLERITSILQGKKDNYDIDLFQNIISNASEIFKIKVTESNKNSFKVIADHLRAVSFMIADGILPSNDGRGYVLRRILRRAIRYSYFLQASDPIIYKLLPSLQKEMGEAYPELLQRSSFISDTIQQEEIKFGETFEKGLKILNQELQQYRKGDVFSGKVAFKLYDTYGFPVDLTQDILRGQNILLNEKEFEESFHNHKNLAKKSWKGSSEVKNDDIYFDIATKIPATIFTGYEKLVDDSKVLLLLKQSDSNLEETNILSVGESGYIVLENTPFYAELGGQVADKGQILTADSVANVLDVQKQQGNIFYHKIAIIKGQLKLNQTVKLCIDKDYRKDIERHHSSVHLLLKGLIDILGDQVTQQGSMVNSNRIRLDISHNKAISVEELDLVEKNINQMLLENHPVIIKEMPFNKAVQHGAIPLFNEKYPEIARTVQIGDEFSIINDFELCGGTHVKNTGEIGAFIILSEGSVGSGIRRIEAIAGNRVLEYLSKHRSDSKKLSKLLATESNNVISKVESLILDNNKLKKDYHNLAMKSIIDKLQNSKEIINHFKTKENINIIFSVIDVAIEGIKLKDIINNIITISKNEKMVVVIFMKKDNKISFACGCSNNMEAIFDFKIFTKILLEVIDGTGGGSNNFIQGSCKVQDTIKTKEKIINLLCNL